MEPLTLVAWVAAISFSVILLSMATSVLINTIRQIKRGGKQ